MTSKKKPDYKTDRNFFVTQDGYRYVLKSEFTNLNIPGAQNLPFETFFNVPRADLAGHLGSPGLNVKVIDVETDKRIIPVSFTLSSASFVANIVNVQAVKWSVLRYLGSSNFDFRNIGQSTFAKVAPQIGNRLLPFAFVAPNNIEWVDNLLYDRIKLYRDDFMDVSGGAKVNWVPTIYEAMLGIFGTTSSISAPAGYVATQSMSWFELYDA